jgi:hypothetical protein
LSWRFEDMIKIRPAGRVKNGMKCKRKEFHRKEFVA